MKYLRGSLTLVFSLLLAAAAQAQAQRAGARVIVRPDGLDIRLNDQARWNAATSWPGAMKIAQDVINEIERGCRGCYQIDPGKLAFQISYHSAFSYAPNERVQRRANPVNVTWPELRPTDWRALNRAIRRDRGRGQSPYALSQQREPPDRQRLSPRAAAAIRAIERRLVEAQERDRRATRGYEGPSGPSDRDRQRLSPRAAEAIRAIERRLVESQERDRREGGRTGGGTRDAAPTRDKPAKEAQTWGDRIMEIDSRRP